MKLLDRMKHYNFWVALSMAVIILLNTLSKAFNFNINDAIINDIIMAILGILVVLGFVQKDNYDFVDTSKNADNDETNVENEENQIYTNKEELDENEIDLDTIIEELKNDRKKQ